MGLSTLCPLPFSYGSGVPGATRRTTRLAEQAMSLGALCELSEAPAWKLLAQACQVCRFRAGVPSLSLNVAAGSRLWAP